MSDERSGGAVETAALFYNQTAKRTVAAATSRAPLAFHRRLPSYAPTPLVDAPTIAGELGVGRVWIKDESSRLGLPAFKILGAAWAIYRALSTRLGREPAGWTTLDELADRFRPLGPLTLVAATDGNHGRAVARMARLLGLAARVYIPASIPQPRIDAIRGEGAEVIVVDSTYDEAVAMSARDADERHLVISDTAWLGYEAVPRWTIDGYETIFWEIDDELAARSEDGPDVVLVQIGVGALAASVVAHYRRAGLAKPPKIVGVEPLHACSMLRSLQAGELVTVPGPHDSIMAGLNCGASSPIAWPLVSAGVDLLVAVDDERARQAMRTLAHAGVVSGETGGAGLAGLIDLLDGPNAGCVRDFLGMDETTRVLCIVTEGANDPAAYTAIVGALQ